MARWEEFAEAAPEMAALGLGLLEQHGLAYLATTRKDGSPRVNPVCPFIGLGRLYIATAPTSPKRLDLERDGRYALHMLPGKDDAEFSVEGRARLVSDEAERERVMTAGRETPMPGGGTLNLSAEEWLFEYDIESAASAYWENVGQPDTRPIRQRWPE